MIAEIETEVRGVPCIIRVTSWEPYLPPKLSGPPDSCCQGEGGFGDYVILTRRGRPATRIEKKMSKLDRERLDLEVFEFVEGSVCR